MAKTLINVYKVLDEKRKTNITEKIIRVLSARGFNISDLIIK